MNLSGEAYNTINGPQTRDAEELLQLIKKEVLDKNERVGLILDIGCGTGNVTELMADFIPHDRILALDVEKTMVEMSRNLLCSKYFIKALVQDFGQPWEKLDERLRAVEGQVDLVWSNFVLHWINDSLRPHVASNIFRLLRPGGRFYMNLMQLPNYNETLPANERERNEKLLKIPIGEEQQRDWREYFKNAGFDQLNVDYLFNSARYEDNSVFDKLMQGTHMIATYLPVALDEVEKKRILDKFGAMAVRNLATPRGSKLIEKIESHHKTFYYGRFRITGQK